MLTLQNTDAIRRIEASIGYTFRDKRLLVQVFTRKTYMRVDPETPDNEVLEFYGDMLMSYHVTTYFIEKFAHMLDDGLYFMRTVEQFTEMRSHYVRNQYLTDRIKQLIPNLERLVRAQNPRLELPRDNQKAYADLFESLIGAVYLDSYRDDELIRTFILRHLNIEPKDAAETTTHHPREAVTVLPSVTLPMDEPETAELPLSAMDAMATEEAMLTAVEKAPREAVAIESALVIIEPPAVEAPADASAEAPVAPIATVATAASAPAISHVEARPANTTEPPHDNQDALNAFCREAGYEPPVYGEAPKNAPNARPVAACTVCFRNGRGKPVKISLNDSGKTLNEATERAAAKMLKKLREQKETEDKAPAGKSEQPKAMHEPAEGRTTATMPTATESPAAESCEQASEASETIAEAPVKETAIESVTVVSPEGLMEALTTVTETVTVAATPEIETAAASAAPASSDTASPEAAPTEESPAQELTGKVAPILKTPRKRRTGTKADTSSKAPKSRASGRKAAHTAPGAVPAEAAAPAAVVEEPVATAPAESPVSAEVPVSAESPIPAECPAEAVIEQAVATPVAEKKSPRARGKKAAAKPVAPTPEASAATVVSAPSTPTETPAEAEAKASVPPSEKKPRRPRAAKPKAADKVSE